MLIFKTFCRMNSHKSYLILIFRTIFIHIRRKHLFLQPFLYGWNLIF